MALHAKARFPLWLIAVVFGTGLNISCDEPATEDDDDDAVDNFHISVDGALKLSVMTSHEAYQVCKDIAQAFNSVIDKDTQCLRISIAAGQIAGNYDEGICNDSYLACSTDNLKDYQSCDKYEETDDKYEDCDARVSEFDKCIKRTISDLRDEYEGLTCSSEDMLDPDEMDQCSACKDLEEKCPGITTNFDRLF